MICDLCADTGKIIIPPTFHGASPAKTFVEFKRSATRGPTYACPLCDAGKVEHTSTGKPFLPKSL